MKLCIDCKHLQRFYCKRPRGEVSPVDGTRVRQSNDAEAERRGGKVVAWLTATCGHEARFFEPKQ